MTKPTYSKESLENWLNMPITQAFFDMIRTAKINSTMARIHETSKPANEIDPGNIVLHQGACALAETLLNVDTEKLSEAHEEFSDVQKAAKKYMEDEFGRDPSKIIGA